MKATFNINSGIFGQTHIDHQSGLTIKRFDADEKLPHIYKKHEIAVHSLTHPDLTKCTINEIRHEIHQDILNLSNRFNQSMIGMAYPYGTYNDEVVSIIEGEGLKYARTVYPGYGFKKQSDLMRFKPTCHFNDHNIHNLIHRFLFEQSEEPMILYLWGNS